MCYCVLVPATCAAWFLFKVPPAILTATGHVALNRVDRKSQLECLKQCGDLLHKCASVLFFPEGTRSKTKKMAGFKKGAFSVAVKAGVDVVPITLLGTGGHRLHHAKECRVHTY